MTFLHILAFAPMVALAVFAWCVARDADEEERRYGHPDEFHLFHADEIGGEQ